MAKSKRGREEAARFKEMPEADLIELRAILHREVSLLMREKDMKIGTIKRIMLIRLTHTAPNARTMGLSGAIPPGSFGG